MKNSILILLVSLFTVCCIANSQPDETDEPGDEEWTVYVSPFKQVLFSEDHTSEGFLAPLDDGRILLLFRLDPGMEGDHVGEDGYIAKIIYDPEQDQWGEVETVYNSHQYDDRNIHGGVTNDGRIVVFFRRYIPSAPDNSKTEGRYFIYSDDNGQTWSDPQINKVLNEQSQARKTGGNMSTGQMFYNPDIDKYVMSGFLKGHDKNRKYIVYSRDGTLWEGYNQDTDQHDFQLNEIAGAWIGDNRIIALQRDDEREHGHPLVQVESYDNGQTWSDPQPTNIPPKQHWGAAPQLIYDQKRDLLIALNSDRYSRKDEKNSLFIYTARPDEVIGNPEGWTLQHELRRPWAALNFEGNRPLNQNLYGYSTIAPINDEEYLVVFTERAVMEGSEQADLYYYRLMIK